MENSKQSKYKAMALSMIATALLVVAITGFSVDILGEYGIVLFTMTPFMLGLLSVVIYGSSGKRTRKESVGVAFQTMAMACGLLIMVKIEGIVCVIMASPFVGVLVWLGALVGHKIQIGSRNTSFRLFSTSLLAIPLLMVAESAFIESESGMIEVKTSIIIQGSQEDVWRQVVAFPEIPDPTEWLFKTGIAYPTSSEIIGEGAGAVRYCKFTTGQFVEPITIWDEPNHLQFTVEKQPIPLKRMIDEDVPGNMYKYFVSTKGEFRLKEIAQGRVLLEGTTWYYHRIRPVFYWKIWSKYIIHSIHSRVLHHIKNTVESLPKQ